MESPRAPQEPTSRLQSARQRLTGDADFPCGLLTAFVFRFGFGMGPDKMLDKLEDCDFLCVVIYGTLRLRQDLIEELREQAVQG